jgi:hypothetical protein
MLQLRLMNAFDLFNCLTFNNEPIFYFFSVLSVPSLHFIHAYIYIETLSERQGIIFVLASLQFPLPGMLPAGR